MDWPAVIEKWRREDVPRIVAGEEIAPPPHPSLVAPDFETTDGMILAHPVSGHGGGDAFNGP